MTLDDFRERQGFYCPACGVHLHSPLKGDWAYRLATPVIAFLIPYLQGSKGSAFVFEFLVYWALIMVSILYLSWPLMLPRKFIVDEPHVQTLGIDSSKRD
jgi:hypothetical protein